MRKIGITITAAAFLAAAVATAQDPRFSRDTSGAGQPVVNDARTGLTWQGCAMGQTGNACTGTPAMTGWQAAVNYCEGLEWGGHTDWRLPAQDELLGIVDRSRSQPAIDTGAFPENTSGWYWSSTAYTSKDNIAWGVFFHNGTASVVDKKIRFLVRCVRASK